MVTAAIMNERDAAYEERRPRLVRPVPRRVSVVKATTIHPRMVENFTSECQNEGIPASTIESAVQQSREWHQKWTLQDEQAHTTEGWRLEGAKNPSPFSSSSDDDDELLHVQATAIPPWSQATLQSPILRPVATRPMNPSPLALPLMARSFDQDVPMRVPASPTQSSVHSALTQTEQDFCLETCKERVYHALAVNAGDVTADAFLKAIEPLVQHYQELDWDAREPSSEERTLEGMWLTLSKATFFGNLGENPSGDPMYTLGRMAFDMFLPTQLVCSLQGNFNPVHIVPDEERAAILEKIPKSLLEEVEMGNNVLRTYNIVTAFTIEPHLADFPNAPNKNVRRPIKGIMTTFGYVLPDPLVPNRLSIWFTGGNMVPNDDEYDQREWHRLFSHHEGEFTNRTFAEKTRVLAANLLMGAQVPTELKDDGTLEYTFTRPLGGHGVAYVDVLYLDSSLRIVKGHRGTFFVFTRIPDHEEL